jgi:hypothetical protein
MSAAETVEAEKVLRVKLLCQLTIGSAETVAANDIDDDMYEYEKERYHKNKLKALQMTNSIADRFYFEAALHEIIGLCLAAKVWRRDDESGPTALCITKNGLKAIDVEDEAIPGQQAAIIDRDLFDAVQAKLNDQRTNHTAARAKLSFAKCF